jgi:thioredoxin reductase
MKKKKAYDVIIVGGSYAGLSAGMALGRALRSVLIIDSGNACNKQTPYSHNFLTNDGKTPVELAGLARQQVRKYDTVEFADDLATAAKQTSGGFEVQVETGETYCAEKLVFATGIKDIFPPISGFAASWGISALHCPYCHGYEVRQQKTGILSSGDTGFEMSMLISNWTNDLTLYSNGNAGLSNEQQQKLKQHGIGIDETPIEKLEHKDGYIQHMLLKNGSKVPLTVLYARLPFVQHCDIPKSLGCEITDEGYIKVDQAHKTTVAGVFACGDNISRMRTVANAVAMGTTTGLMVNKELIEEQF